MKDRRKPRKLRDEEEAIWRRVASTARPLHPSTSPKPEPRKPAETFTPDVPEIPPAIEPFAIGRPRGGGVTIRLAPTADDWLRGQSINLDRRSYQKLKRGRLKPEARIDLHGMTLAQAEPALRRFLSSAASRGLRLVLVITGKGRDRDDDGPVPERPGILKRTVPMWLATDPAVLQVAESHQRHGGAGAYYVYLRRGK